MEISIRKVEAKNPLEAEQIAKFGDCEIHCEKVSILRVAESLPGTFGAREGKPDLA